MNQVDIAMQIAFHAHHGQVNKYSGEPYILHPHRVSMSVGQAEQAYSSLKEKRMAAAWLHDVLEDNNEWTFHRLVSNNVQLDVAKAVVIMTKQKGVSNEDYYAEIAKDPLAKIVKYYDIQDNFSRNHLIEDEVTRLRMAKKYSLGMDMLK